MTKPPLAVARRATATAAAALPLDASSESWPDYTRPQLVALLADSSDLRREVGPAEGPHSSALVGAAARSPMPPLAA